MGLEEASGSLSSSIRCRVDAVGSEDGADGGIGDLVAEVCQCSPDAVVSPCGILIPNDVAASKRGRNPDLIIPGF